MTPPDTTVSFIDVGQGDCTVAVDSSTGDGLLIDCRTGAHERTIEELWHLGMRQLVNVIISHSHEDHFGGVLEVVERLGDIFTGDIFENHESLMAVPVAGDARKVAGRKLRAMINRLREYPGRVHRAEAHVTQGTAGRIRWRILAPTYDEVLAALADGNPNLASGIVLIELGDATVIVGGDAQMPTWMRVASGLPRGGVLRWPHHGGAIGDEVDAEEWLLATVDPSTVVVSVGSANTHGHPSTAFFDAAAKHPSRLLCTEATKACVAHGLAPSVCAGTVRIDLATVPATVFAPRKSDHDAVVDAYGNGQCRRAEGPRRP